MDNRSSEEPEALQSLQAKFALAANTVVDLYREGQRQRDSAYKRGYEKCLLDIMDFLNTHPHVQQRQTGASERMVVDLEDLVNWARAKHGQLHGAYAQNTEDSVNGQSQQLAIIHQSQPQQASIQQPQPPSSSQSSQLQPSENTTHSSASDHEISTFPHQTLHTNSHQLYSQSALSGTTSSFQTFPTASIFDFTMPQHMMVSSSQREIEAISVGQDGGIGIWGSAGELKRKFGGNEVGFLGKSIPVEGLIEMPSKRSRIRREEIGFER
ncbi:1351_t:CDS:2 [Paraglomus occultum]|uniref:1351_t:CDS:1 n=1 Tax=Paraglomus occultum TaxID=144539 RepID=A0A9N9DG84_9GLOM|nr:1351_t:CDS:2 [Paraglomus occultum]